MKKRTNKKLVLNKKKISELSTGELRGAQGGKPKKSFAIDCISPSFGWDCWESELYTACHCETKQVWHCEKSIDICEA